MRRTSRFALLLVAAAALSANPSASARADDDGQTRSFPDHNFKLTLPAKWEWDTVADVDKEAGFVLIARRKVQEGKEATVRVRVVDAAGQTSEALLAQVKDAKTKDLQGPTTDDTGLEWGGVPARRLSVTGKHENGAQLTFEVYGAVVAGKFHQMDIRCINGVEEDIRDELNELASGYEILKAPAAGDGGSDAKRVQKFPKFALTWTLPKETSTAPPLKEGEQPRAVRWAWGTGSQIKPDLDPGENGLIAVAILQVGDDNQAQIEVQTQKAPVGMTALLVTQNDDNFKSLLENFSDVPAPRIDEEAEIGNLHGASRTYIGKNKDAPPRPLYFKVNFAVVKDLLFQVLVRADEKAEQNFKPQIKAGLAGLQWDTKEGIRGPYITPFPTYTDVRPDEGATGPPDPKRAQEADLGLSALSLKKPAPFVLIKFDANKDRRLSTFQVAAEGRKEGVYAFVGIQYWRGKVFADEKLTVEGLVDNLENEWKNDMTDPVTLTQKGGKANKRPDSLANAKGQAYEFRGKRDAVPYVEKGWAVKNSGGAYLVRVQYGGKDAEAAFASEIKVMLKSLKLGN